MCREYRNYETLRIPYYTYYANVVRISFRLLIYLITIPLVFSTLN